MADDFDLSFGFYDDSDPNKVADDYEKFPEGDCPVNGIYDLARDDTGMPFYNETNGKVQALVRLRQIDGSEGPPMYCTAPQLALLVMAFGGDVNALPKDRSSVSFLEGAMVAANTGGKKQIAHVNASGWVSYVTGADLPANRLFRLKLAGMRSVSGKTGNDLRFEMEKKFGKREVIYVDFRVVGNAEGRKTIYDGAQVTVQLETPFSGTITAPNGKVYPRARKAQRDNAQLMAVKRFANLIRVFWPEAGEYEYETDATRSDFGVNEAEEPIVVIQHYALNGGRVGAALLTAAKSGRTVLDLKNLMTLEEAAGADVLVPEENAEPEQTAEDKPTYRQMLADYIDSLVYAESGVSAFKNANLALSTEGAAWCKQHLVPVWDSLAEDMPEERKLKLLSEKQAQVLLKALSDALGESLNVAEEEDEAPF